MNVRVYRETYLAALEVAHSDLDNLAQEGEMLQHRKEQLEGALGALEPFLRSVRQSAPESHQSEPTLAEQVRVEQEQEFAKSLFRAVHTPEPVVPALFSPVSDAALDPIQSRINQALGLAVA